MGAGLLRCFELIHGGAPQIPQICTWTEVNKHVAPRAPNLRCHIDWWKLALDISNMRLNLLKVPFSQPDFLTGNILHDVLNIRFVHTPCIEAESNTLSAKWIMYVGAWNLSYKKKKTSWTDLVWLIWNLKPDHCGSGPLISLLMLSKYFYFMFIIEVVVGGGVSLEFIMLKGV